MKITYAPQPFVSSFMMFADFKIEECKAAKKVQVELYDKSKTRISITFQFEETKANVNFIAKGSEGYKFDTISGINYFSGGTSTNAYWKVTKKQGMRTLEDHLKNVAAQVFGISKEDEFELIVIRSRAFNMLNTIEPVSIEQYTQITTESDFV